MDHKEATRIQAVDRYLLGELSTEEQQGFEEHFFSCGECSEDLRMGAILVDNSRAVLRDEFLDPLPARPDDAARRPGWLGWWSGVPMAVAAALVVLVGYQNLVVLPGYRRQAAENVDAAVPLHVTVRPAVRGVVPVVSLPRETRFFEIRAVEVDFAAGGHDCEIRNDRGKVVASLHAPPIETGEKLTVLLDARRMPAGPYVLVVRKSSGGAEIGQYPFTIEIN